MKLHEFPNEFKMLISIVAEYMHLPESAIERDYYIVLLLKNLAESEFAEQCVFKGGTLGNEVRHIYDVTRLYQLSEIKELLNDTDELKCLMKMTKDTDSYYLGKRNISKAYDPTKAYNFANWKEHFTIEIKNKYENLHKELLYTDEKQKFEDAIKVFELVDIRLQEIGE